MDCLIFLISAPVRRSIGPAKTVLARKLVEVIAAAATHGRMVHVVADGAYLCTSSARPTSNS